MTFEFDHNITMLEMSILDKGDYVEFEPALLCIESWPIKQGILREDNCGNAWQQFFESPLNAHHEIHWSHN